MSFHKLYFKVLKTLPTSSFGFWVWTLMCLVSSYQNKMGTFFETMAFCVVATLIILYVATFSVYIELKENK